MLHKITEKTFRNGLKLVYLNKPQAPIVAVQVWYKVGSICESDGIRGISHVLEHMMFRGSDNYRSEQHAQMINEVGGNCNAFTTEDVTAYINSVPHDSLDLVLALEADRMDKLTLDPDLFETERKVIIEEYHTYLNNPVAKAVLEFREEFFKGHPYAISPLGTLNDLNSMTVEDLRQYYSNWYSPDNAVLVVVGDFDEDVIENKVERIFGDKEQRNIEKRQLEFGDHLYAPANRMVHKVKFDVPILMIGYPAPPSSHKDAIALEILQMVASGGESSRIHKEIVRKESLAVMAGGINNLLKRAGMSMFFAAFTPDIPAGKIEAALKMQINRIRNEGINAQEMEKVKNTVLTNHTFELYSVENICHHIGFSECIEGNYSLWVKRLNTLKSIDTGELTEIARNYWKNESCHVLYLKPEKTNLFLFAAGLFRRFFKKAFGRD